MRSWWQYWPGYLSETDCEKVIELAQQLPATVGQIGHGAGELVTDLSYRRSTIRWIPRADTRFLTLFSRMELLFHEANASAFGFALSIFRDVQFTEYAATNNGTYAWHHDTTWASDSHYMRKLSMVIQLSNPADYTGGELQLATEECGAVPDAEVLRQRGTVLVFPSFLRHCVTPVKSGIRYSLVTWYEGPCFR